MDIADDIAYSTYDLDDCIIAGIATPIDIISCTDDDLTYIALQATGAIKKAGYTYKLDANDMRVIFFDLFKSIFTPLVEGTYNFSDTIDIGVYVSRILSENKLYMSQSKLRRTLTEALIDDALNSISVKWNSKNPELSQLDIKTLYRVRIEGLKAFNYTKVINSHRLRVDSQRGRDVVLKLFDKLFYVDKDGLMIDDSLKANFIKAKEEGHEAKARFVCDYIATMTDRQALDMYAKMTSAAKTTIFGVSF